MARTRAADKSGKGKEARQGKRFDRGLWVTAVVAGVLALIPFALGKYLEFGMNGAFDGGLNVYSAQQIVKGWKLKEEVMPSARPATLLVNVVGVALFGFRELGPKLIQMLMQAGALTLMFVTVRRAYGNLAAGAALVLGAFYLSCPPYAKYGNVKEQFMIACMITAACGLMLRHLGGAWWWLLVSGGTAANIIYFKQTGGSVMAAMFIYVLAQPMLGKQRWKDCGKDVGLLLAGAGIGLLPLTIFFASQGQLVWLMKLTPVLRGVVMKLEGKTQSVAEGLGLGAYVEESRKTSVFSTQFDWVMGYMRTFVVPTGLALTALGWRLVRLGGQIKARLSGKKGQEEDKGGTADAKAEVQAREERERTAEGFVLLLGIWWLLDVIFVWVSPRAYVEYFLPQSVSGVMLGAYAIWRCRQRPVGWAALPGVWLGTALVMRMVVGESEYPYVRWEWERLRGFVGGWLLKVIPFAAGVGAVLLWRRAGQRRLRAGVLMLLVLIAAVWWNGENLATFGQRVEQMQKIKAAGQKQLWEQIGLYVRNHSEPGDGLYVWGWYPGIYVQAQRFSPTRRPAYSNMHTDNPGLLAAKILSWIEEMKADPPKFIVDSKKMHFPFYDHPVFELWPVVPDGKGGKAFMPRRVHDQLEERLLERVEQETFYLLTHENRRGGPVDEETARELAEIERERHEVMMNLRWFVMDHYRPVTSPASGMQVFELVRRPETDGEGG